MTAWGKITAKRDDSVCGNCDAPMGLGTTIYWLKGTKGYQCSVECNQARASKLGIALDAPQGTAKGQTPTKPDNTAPTAPPTANRTVSRPMVRCEACMEMVYPDEASGFITAVGDHVFVCYRCEWVAKAQRGLKLLGLWKPVKREEAKE